MKNTAYDILSHHPGILSLVGLVAFLGSAWLAASVAPVRMAAIGRVVLGLWIVAVFVVTLSKLPIGPGFEQQVNLVPGNFLSRSSRNHGGLLQSLANVAMFVPLGVLGPLALRLTTRGVIVSGFVASFTIEILQWVLHTGRASDINDVILNTLGAAVASITFAPTVRAIQSRRTQAAARAGH